MSQEKQIINHILEHGHITMLEAFGVYRVYNLKGRIADLRYKHGKDFITTDMRTDDTGKKYARYSISPQHIFEAESLVADHAQAA